jgi:hypothetical protein
MVVGFGVAGPKRQRLFVVGDCLAQAPQALKGGADIEVRVGLAGIETQRRLVIGDRLCGAVQTHERDADAGLGPG